MHSIKQIPGNNSRYPFISSFALSLKDILLYVLMVF